MSLSEDLVIDGTLSSSNAEVTTASIGALVSSTVSSGSFYATNSTIKNAVSTNVSSATLNLTTGLTSASARITNVVSTTISAGTLIGTIFTGANMSLSEDLVIDGTLSSSNAEVTIASIGTLISSSAKVTTMTAGTMLATDISSVAVNATNSTITNLVATNNTVTNLIATNNTVTNLVATNNTVTNVIATNLSSGTLNLSTGLTSENAQITNVVSTTISAGTLVGTIFTGGSMSLSGDLVIGGTLTTVNITTTNVVDTHITSANINITSLATIVNANVTTMTAGNARVTNVTTGTLNVSSLISVSDTTNAPAGAVTGTNVQFSGGMSYLHQLPPDEFNPNGSNESRPYYYSSEYFVTALPVDPTPGYNPYSSFYNPTAFKYTGSSSAVINWRVQTPGASAGFFGTYTIYVDILDTDGTTIISTPATLVYSSESLVTDTGIETTTLNPNQYIRFRGDGMSMTINNFVFTYDFSVNVSGLIANSSGITTGTLKAIGITSASAQFTTMTSGTARVTTSLIALGNSNTIGSIVTTGGNVGFGTSNPSDLVHLYTATPNSNIGQIFQTGSRQYRVGVRGDISNSFVIQDDTASQAYFAINTSGDLTITGDITAFGSISDRRFKENIQSITTDIALDKVKNLRPVTFTWKSNIANLSKIGTNDVGFIAQEVEEVVEYAVGEFSDLESGEVYKKIKHERIIPYLVGAIQKLEARISELEGKL